MPRPISYAVFCLKKKKQQVCRRSKIKSRIMPLFAGMVFFVMSILVLFIFFFIATTPTSFYSLSLHDALPIFDVLPRTPGNNVYVGFMVWSNFTATKCRGLVSVKLDQTMKPT